jgi:hypothetical protein
MVCKITSPASIKRAINYNEKKVQKGVAACIYAANFLQDAKTLNFYDKLYRFENLIELNARAKTNTLHISLNFEPSEKFSSERLTEIAAVYMEKIGFGDQPYLVYRHDDSGHPHVHIVTTSIQENRNRINTYNLGRNGSEKARKEIEATYGLIKAKGRKNSSSEHEEVIPVQKIRYGLTDTKRSITNVLSFVLHQYRYTSLPELNALLQLYNLVADRGQTDGRIFRNRGLTYSLLDSTGKKIGVPIKASSIYYKPTLNFLEEKFKQNEPLRAPNKARLKNAIDWALAKKPDTLPSFIQQLEKEKVNTVIRSNEQEFIYGITFIDHRSRCVFNGSDLGKQYTAATIQERMVPFQNEKANSVSSAVQKHTYSDGTKDFNNGKRVTEPFGEKQFQETSLTNNTWELLMKKERTGSRVPFDFVKKKKRRKPKL